MGSSVSKMSKMWDGGGGAKTLVLSLDRSIDRRSLTWSLYLSMALPLESYEE